MRAVDSIEHYIEFALPLYETRDSAHNADHIRRIIARLDELSNRVDPPPRRPVLYFLASFHGLGGRLTEDPQFDGEVRRFLAQLGWSDREVAEAFLLLHRAEFRTPQGAELAEPRRPVCAILPRPAAR